MTVHATAVVDTVVSDPRGVLLGLDFDGTLAPIVDDPARASIHPASRAALARLAPRLGTVAIITGRPVDQALAMGSFADAVEFGELIICGQYGAERWDAATGIVQAPPVPPGVAALAEALPRWLAEHGAADARIEPKGLAVAVHTRGTGLGLDDLRAPLADLAAGHGLVVEPGREVLELRGTHVTKGETLTALLAERGARSVVYAGDDLGDLPAFEAVAAAREAGLAGVAVASASTEQSALLPLADLVLDGPDGVAAWLTSLADALDAAGQAGA